MHKLQLFLTIISICCSGITIAATDTIIQLESVSIHGDRFNAFTAGSKTLELDSADLSAYKSSDISKLLATRSGIFIKNYGPGMLATPTLRGSSASQTAIIWNGFNIQSPMHGQNDFSLIPVFFSDKIEIQHGSTGAIWGSGAIGGVVNLSNNVKFDGKLMLQSEVTASSIKNYNQLISIKGSNKNFASTLRVFNQNDNNRFNYTKPGIPDSIYTRDYANSERFGIMNEIYYRNNSNHFATVRWWYQNNNRQIPPTLFQTHSGAYQDDETLRITTDYKKTFSKSLINVKFAYFDENILYRDSARVESLSNAKTWIQELDYRISTNNNHSFSLGANNQIVNSDADNYDSLKSLQRLALFSLWKWNNLKETLSLFASARQEFQKDQNIPFIPSAGFMIKFSDNYSLKANIGKNFRMPSFNDLYWVPGGNPELQPESGWNQDLSLHYLYNEFANNTANILNFNIIDFSLTAFHRKIDNWIIWLPQSGIWTPQNIMEVRSMGIETQTITKFKLNNISNSLSLNYDYTSSKNEKQKSPDDASVGKQLIYVPKHNARLVYSMNYKSFGFYYEHYYTGKRYTSSDNTEYLDPYQTINAGINYTFNIKKIILTTHFDAVNILNEKYMIVAANPMPLRYFRFRINVKWEKLL